MTERATPDEPGPVPTDAFEPALFADTVRWWETWLAPGFVVVTALASLLLAAMLFFVYRAIGDASLQLARGEGVQLAEAVHDALRSGPRPPQALTLASLLARKRAQGLLYVAVLRPEGNAIEIQAGEPVSPLTPAALASLHSMEPVLLHGRVRFASMPPGPGGPGGRPPGDLAGPPDDLQGLPDPWDGPEPPRGDRPPPPPRGGAGPRRLVIEFQPIASQHLMLLARRTVLAGLIAIPAFVCCALLLAYLVQQRNRLVRRLEHGRRLAALGEMSAVLAHEIRNPLASLKGHAQLLARSLEGDQARGAKAELIVREAIRLQDLATDLLDFARAGATQRRDADPALLLRESVEAVDAERIELALDAAPRSWQLDPERMRQVLINVLRNAVQASPDGAPVRAAVFAEHDQLVFEIRDHGRGLEAGDERRIFEPFHTRKLRGTGLGLAIARRIVDQQGGSIVAANAPTGGAVFRISIARL